MTFKKLTFTEAGDGLSQSYVIPSSARAISFQPDGNVYQHNEQGKDDDSWPVCMESMLTTDLVGQTLYFTGDEAASLYIKVVTGLGG